MKEIKFVDANNLSTLEEYGAAILSSMISLRTLEAFHVSAMKKGLLDEDETETCTTIMWEIKRLLALYQTQMNHIAERTNFDESRVLETLKTMMPNIKVTAKRKKKDEIPHLS